MTWMRVLVSVLVLMAPLAAQEPASAPAPTAEALAAAVQLHEKDVAIWDLRRQNKELLAQIASLLTDKIRAEEALLGGQQQTLQAERTRLDALLRAAAGAPADAAVDWSKSPPVVAKGPK